MTSNFMLTDFQVWKEYCFQCFRKLNIEQRKECLKCGVMFCNDDCFQLFSKHDETCKLRELLKNIGEQQQQQQQQGNIIVEQQQTIKKVISELLTKKDETKSIQERLLMALLISETFWILKDERALYEALGICVDLLRKLSLYDKALLFTRNSLSIAERLFGSNSKEFVDDLKCIAETLTLLNRYDEAKQYLVERALPICIEQFGENSIQYARLLICRGGIYRSLCKYDDALRDFKQSVQLLSDDKSTMDYYVAVTSIGDVLFTTRHFEQALDRYQHALDVQQTSIDNDHSKRARLFSDIGETLSRLNRFDEARPFLQQSLHSWRQVGDRSAIVCCLLLLGDMARAERRYDEALQFYEQTLAMQREMHGVNKPHADIVATLNRIGAVFDAQGQLDEALAKSRENLAISMQLQSLSSDDDDDDENHINVATNLRNIGSLLVKKGDFDSAIEHLQRALTIFEKIFESDEEQIDRMQTMKCLQFVKAFKLLRQ